MSDRLLKKTVQDVENRHKFNEHTTLGQMVEAGVDTLVAGRHYLSLRRELVIRTTRVEAKAKHRTKFGARRWNDDG